MRTTVSVDDELYQQAIELSDPAMEKVDIFREALKTYVQVKAAQRLAALGGNQPDMEEVPRRRDEVKQ
ncbi:type II toxin-antitoxin system VapB family antitoxin [Pokkaliibacter sp. MBI-7]|uniref:type II toxin-antitoxin system VapB family antitoxin n=1 Tax=Pokkaliibacter sp. MBI-7 TaxID=3040600 RepID=UPI0024495747|nr:type II toxin-antitoxin system VapB family antitoxin [Pokkaliibacter sp. MBI-7]MDH2435922.1 type II toxin-antitoxin system VapB family antitoxin [Pokkaliibacter sp. MBI-7]